MYGGESWWNGASETPPTGMGGFGVSRFFSAPAYQGSSGMRAVPDVVADADPSKGIQICQADDGGCPSGKSFGGTSMAAPEWAAYFANLNTMFTSNLGNANARLYPSGGQCGIPQCNEHGKRFCASFWARLAGFSAASRAQPLIGMAAGPAGASQSLVAASGSNPDGSAVADGTTVALVQAMLIDGNGFAASGRTLSVSAGAGSHATIIPTTASSDNDGNATFQVSDSTVEDVTLTVTDSTDSVTLAQTPVINFVAPPAVSAGISDTSNNVGADGLAFSIITVTLQDAANNPSPGKQVVLAQGTGHSNVSGPASGRTDSTGTIRFTVTDTTAEVVTYTATDVTDGNLPVSGSAIVTFSGGTNPPCSNLGVANPVSGSPFAVNQFVTGFKSSFANGACFGPTGMAYDQFGNMYVATYLEGNIYKFGPSGGTANPAQLINATPYASTNCLSGLAFSKDGQHLYMARQFCASGGGDVIEIRPTDGSIIREVVPAISCATALATDPISGDLFVSQPCEVVGSNNIVRISKSGVQLANYDRLRIAGSDLELGVCSGRHFVHRIGFGEYRPIYRERQRHQQHNSGNG